MAKSSGGTRGSSSNSPRGLNLAIRASIARGGADWSNRELVDLRDRQFNMLRSALDAQAGKDGWREGFNNITKDFGDDSPVMSVTVSVYQGGIEDGSYYVARPSGTQMRFDGDYTQEVNALWNNEKRFTTVSEATKWIESQAKRINKKYKGKI